MERGALDPCGAQCRSDRLPPAGPQGQAPAVKPDLTVPTANAFGVAATGWKTYVTVTVKNLGPGAAPQSKLGVAMKLAGVPTPRTLSAANTNGARPGRGRVQDTPGERSASRQRSPGTKFTLQTCADAAKAVAEGREATTAGPRGRSW